jgi:hypothetical protein
MAGKEWLGVLCRIARFGGASPARRCAVLIDGDNTPPRLAGALLNYASGLGRIEILELFANFSSTANTGWAVQMREHGITGLQHYQSSTGKNAADIALVVRAMDLSFTARIDAYVLVSSDADYAALAHRLRKSGAAVHGVGGPNAAATLRQSCTTFLSFGDVSELAASTNLHVTGGLWSRQPGDAEDRLLHALVRLGGARRWVGLGELGEEMKHVLPSFDPRLYSRRTLSDLCDAVDSIEVDRSTSQPRARIALRARNGSPREPVSKS